MEIVLFIFGLLLAFALATNEAEKMSHHKNKFEVDDDQDF